MGENENLPLGDGQESEIAIEASKVLKPPKDLPLEAKRLWAQLREEYQLEDAAGLTYLTTGCRHFARMREAQKILKAEGLTVKGRYGQSLPHPCVKVENDSSASMIKAFKALNLDLEPLQNRVGRPAGR
jgi:phage terminase small subunit